MKKNMGQFRVIWYGPCYIQYRGQWSKKVPKIDPLILYWKERMAIWLS